MCEIGGRPDAGPGPWPWGRVFRCATSEAALVEIAGWLGFAPDTVLDLRFDDDGSDAGVDDGSGGALRVETVLSVRDGWRLVARGPAGAVPPAPVLDRAALAFEAWHAARIERSRAESRLETRARDLETLHALSRRLSEASRLDALVEFAAVALHERAGVEAVGWGHRLGGTPEVEMYAARPLGEDALRRIVSHAAGELGWNDAEPPVVRIRELEGYEDDHGVRGRVSDDELVTVPIVRRGAAVGVLMVLASEPPDERTRRFVYGAANHLALHLDRVLSVQEAEQGRFRSILDSMPQAVVLVDRELRVLQGNAAAAAVLDALGAARGVGLGCIADLDLEPMAREVLSGGRPNASGEAKLADGTILSVTLSPLGGLGVRSEGLVLVVADVTESRRILDRLAQAEKLSSLGRMLSGVAHELNNPLASVLGFAQLTRTAPDAAKLDRRLQVIQDEAGRCQKIVQNLLRFARRHEPERKPLSLNDVVEASVALVGYQLRVDGISMELDLDPDVPSIQGDAHEIQQALVNLITNAHQAIRGEGRGGRVSVHTARLGAERVVVEVRDDGPGIPGSIRSKIFDPFFTTKAVGQGTGLGLALVYATVSAHDGTIEVVDRPGDGTVMRIELPVGAPASTRAALAATPRRDDGARVPARILVVDDERPVASMICESLAADGHDAVAACEAGEVLSRLSEGSFDLVVSDLKMPGLGAERLVEALARLRPGLERRLLLTTGDTVSREPEALASRIGAELLHKPFALEDLRRVVRASLRAAPES